MKQSAIATEKGIIFKIMNAVRLGSCNDEKRRKDALRPYSIWCFQQYLLDGYFSKAHSAVTKRVRLI